MTQNLRTIPEGSEEKRYTVVCHTKEGWENIHQLLCDDNTEEDNVPSHHCECCDDIKMIDTMGTYMLTDAEVEILKNHPQVAGINIDINYYSGSADENKFSSTTTPASKTARYGTTVKHQRNLYASTNILPSSPTADLQGRAGSQFLRHEQKSDTVWGTNDDSIISQDPYAYGDGTDVDVIVCDSESWFGHIEFISTGNAEPTNFVSGNVLDSNGKCGILDIVLDSPYYIDPDFFDADQSNRTIVRWDGTRVPTEQAAKDWWANNTTTYRSSRFASGGADYFGTITLGSPTVYTRAYLHGSDTAKQTRNNTYHGTGCMALAFGKTQGWAYNANKWFIWQNNSAVGDENFAKFMKIFHQYKPNRSSDNTKNPTIVSCSWYGFTTLSYSYYYHRTPGNGTGGVSYTSSTKPKPIDALISEDFAKVMLTTHSTMVAGKAAVDAGVIFCVCANNENQKFVNSDHPDYNNYDIDNSNATLADASTPSSTGALRFINRRGLPMNFGLYNDGTKDVYPAILVGAISHIKSAPDSTLEYKIYYSSRGESVDVFAMTNVIAASDENDSINSRKNRYDNYYTLSGHSQSRESQDRIFGGTSASTPITAGILATKLQYNRTWTWQDIKRWLNTRVNNLNSTEFYSGTESSGINDTNWDDPFNMEGAPLKVIFDAKTSVATADNVTLNGSNLSGSGNIDFNLI